MGLQLVPKTAAIRWRRQSMKPQVKVKWMNHQTPPRQLRSWLPAAAKAAYSSGYFGKVSNAVDVVA